METYLILRRNGWRSRVDFDHAAARSRTAGQELLDEVRWLRSYVLDEAGGGVGSVCIYRGPSPEVIRRHSRLAELPVDEIVAVSDFFVVRPDPDWVAA